MNSQGLCYQPLSQTYLDKQNTHTLYIDMYTVCICIFQYSKWRKTVLPFSVCTFLSPPNTHFFMQNTCCHLYMGTTLFHKGPPPQRSSIALKTNIFTKVAPQVSAVFQEPHLFLSGKEKTKKTTKQTKTWKIKNRKEKKGNTFKKKWKERKERTGKKTEISEINLKKQKITKLTKNEKSRKEKKGQK